MTKAAVSLISLEVAKDTAVHGEPTLKEAPTSRGLLAALVYDALGDLLSQVQDGFQPVHLHRAASAQDVMQLVNESDTALLFGEVMHPDDAFQLLLSLKQLKNQISSGQVRVFVHCTLPSKNFLEKLKAYGCTEVVTSLDNAEAIVQKARMMAELLLFRRAVARLPGGKITSVGLAFMLSEWIAQHGIDFSNMAHLYCACLSAACGGARFEFLARSRSNENIWDCIATNDHSASQWMDFVKLGAGQEKDASQNASTQGGEGAGASQAAGANDVTAEVRIEWIGDHKGALICSADTELSPEQNRLLQAAANLAADFILLDESRGSLKKVSSLG